MQQKCVFEPFSSIAKAKNIIAVVSPLLHSSFPKALGFSFSGLKIQPTAPKWTLHSKGTIDWAGQPEPGSYTAMRFAQPAQSV